MVKGIIFDYGGTLDTAGRHWGKVLWSAYREHLIPVSEGEFREAYVHAERHLGSHRVIMPWFTFHDTLSAKLDIEMGYLRERGYWNVDDEGCAMAHARVLGTLYSGVEAETARSREVVAALAARYPLALVSNFYGNIAEVLGEFGLAPYFREVIESAVVGMRKPDPGIFSLGIRALGLEPGETAVVGDSYDKDIVPAKKAGAVTIWLRGEGWTSDGDGDRSAADHVIGSLSECLDIMDISGKCE